MTTDALKSLKRCGSLMVGSGSDTYDPICDLPDGHSGPCKSKAALDQHRITQADLADVWEAVILAALQEDDHA